jgi:hypothetical protein
MATQCGHDRLWNNTNVGLHVGALDDVALALDDVGFADALALVDDGFDDGIDDGIDDGFDDGFDDALDDDGLTTGRGIRECECKMPAPW